MGEFVETPVSEGSRVGQRAKLNCNAVAIETSINPIRNIGAGLALLGYPKLRQRGQQVFVPVHWMWTGPEEGL